MEKEYTNRINNPNGLENMIKHICKLYEIRDYQNFTIITIGYEDLNIKLKTKSRYYLLKIFSNKRTKKDIDYILHILEKVDKLNLDSYPKIYKVNNQILNSYEENYFILTEWVNGKNLYDLKYKLKQDDIKVLIQEIVDISQLYVTSENIFDSWACINFEKVYLENKKYFDADFTNILDKVNETFRQILFRKLPHSFIHGDIISANVLKNDKGKFFIIDYSVAGYYPRIQEFAVFVVNILFHKDFKQYKEDYDLALTEYKEKMKLNELEIKTLPLYIELAFGMELLGALKEKFKDKNYSEENEHFLKRGLEGLRIVSRLCGL